MKTRLWTGLALAGLLVHCDAPPTPAQSETRAPIIGGVPAEADGDPDTGALVAKLTAFSGRFEMVTVFCTATLIAPDVLLTAAHCEDPFFQFEAFRDFFESEIYFTRVLDLSAYASPMVGQSNELPDDAVQVESFENPGFSFEDFASGIVENKDISLGYLASSIAGVTPATLSDASDASEVVAGRSVWIVGYGQRDPDDGQASGIKFEAESIINEVGPFEMQIGTVPADHPQKCHGDSGGPTFLEVSDGRQPSRRLVGVTSHAISVEADCHEGGVDTRVHPYVDWIVERLEAACREGRRSAEACAATALFPEGNVDRPVDGGVDRPIDGGAVDVPDTGATDAGVEPGRDPDDNDAGPGAEDRDDGSMDGAGAEESSGCAALGGRHRASAPAIGGLVGLMALLVFRRRRALRAFPAVS